MIPVTRFDGTTLIVNVDRVLWIEETPDTVIVLTTGERLLVRERPADLVRRALDFKRAAASGPESRARDDAESSGD